MNILDMQKRHPVDGPEYRMMRILEAVEACGRSPLRGSGLRPFGVEPPAASQAEPLVPNAGDER
jgi:hypothetical protein